MSDKINQVFTLSCCLGLLNTLLDKETGFSSLCAKKITSENHFHENENHFPFMEWA
jgi:hypothetical protein